jgi:hypothetical protein
MTEAVFTLAYRSRSSAPLADEETLIAIQSVSQIHNVSNRLTGALAYGDSYFVQVLEGPEEPLVETMDRIRADTRHHSIDLLGPRGTTNRVFPDWSMARLSVEPGLRHVLSPLFADWHQYGPQAATLLARALDE